MKTKKADWYEYVISAMILLALLFDMLLLFTTARMESWQQPQYVYYYLLIYVILAVFVVILSSLVYHGSDKRGDMSLWALDEERAKTISPFAKWFAKWEGSFYVLFLSGFLFAQPYSRNFDTKYWLHISLGIWLLISTTVAACGFFSLRKARKVYPPDMKPEPPEDGDEEFSGLAYKYHSYKWLVWLLFALRFGAGILSLSLWL